MAAKFWSNVAVAVQTALGTANTITGITKANPAVITYSGSDPANGDYVVLSVVGMTQVHNIVARLANVNAAANTAELEGIDSTLYDTFVSGSFQVVTFGASLSTAVGVSASGGEPNFADISTIHENIQRRVPTSVSPMTLSLDCLYDLSDGAQTELRKAARTLTQRAVRLTFSDGAKMVGSAYVAASGVPTGSAQEAVKTPISLEFQGLPTVYAS